MWLLAGVLMLTAAAPQPRPEASAAADSVQGPVAHEAALRAYAQGRLFEMRGAHREAIAEYYRAMVYDHRAAHIPRHLAELASRFGEFDNALEYIERALRIEPEDAKSLWIRGSILFSMGRAEQALADLRASVARDSGDAERLRTLGRAAEYLDLVDEVERAYSRVVELAPEDGDAWYQLAGAQARLGRFRLADASLGEAREWSAMRPGQWLLEGFVAEQLGRTEDAIGLYTRHIDLHPADLAARRRRVNAYATARRWKEALIEVKHLALAAPDDFETRVVEAEIHLRAGRSAEGQRLIERLAADSSAGVGRTGVLASLLARNRRGKEAVRLADRWRARHPGDPEGPLLAARIRALADQSEAAIPIVRSAVEAQPDSLAPRVLLARLYMGLKRHADAEREYRAARRIHPDEPDLALELANCLEEKGDSDAAEMAGRDALRIDSSSARALNFLGYLLADHNRRLEESEQLILRAVAIEPDNGAYVDSLGWVCFRLGRLTEARLHLERAVDLTRGDAVVREHLGDVYRALQMPAQARDQYRQSLAVDGTNARVRNKLAETSR